MKFFRRRQVWLPTVWTLVAGAVCAALMAYVAVHRIYGFLAPTQPVGARVLAVEGWLGEEETKQVLAVIRAGRYERVLTTGGPTERACDCESAESFADRARDRLVRAGLPAELVVAVPAPDSDQERTFLSAVMVREWAARSGVALDALDVFSVGVHSRRSRRMYQLALGDGVRVGIIAAIPGEYDPAIWWRTSAGSEAVLGETIAWLWSELLFHPGERGSPEETWGQGLGTPLRR